MSYTHEAAKIAIVEVIERQATVESVAFRHYTSWGFCMVMKAKPSDYGALSHRLKAIDLEPYIKRIRQSPAVWYYETVVVVPDDWQFPPSHPAA